MIIDEYYTLANKVEMPKFGIGTWRLIDNCDKIVEFALKKGIKLIDTAWIYNNHELVGKGIANANVDRSKIFVTSKVWDYSYPVTKKDIIKKVLDMLKVLQLDYLDLLLVHWPFEITLIMWRAFEELYKSKKVRAIGVSNFTITQLKGLMKVAKIKPMVNQIQLGPTLQRKEIVKFCQSNGIVVTSWQTLDEGNALKVPQIQAIAKKHNATPAQVCLKWALNKNIVVIPKSAHEKRIVENMSLDGFNLSADDMKTIDALDDKNREAKKMPQNLVKSGYKYDTVTW